MIRLSVVLLSIALAHAQAASQPQASTPPQASTLPQANTPPQANTSPGVELSVLEVRALTEKDSLEHAQGVIGPNVLVRLRILNRTEAGVLVLTTQETMDPLACVGKVSSTGNNCWPKLLKIPNQWLLLPSGGALEWDEMDSTAFAGQEHVVTIAVRGQDEADPERLATPTYKVPAAIYQPKTDHDH